MRRRELLFCLLFAQMIVALFLLGSASCFAESRALYDHDENSGLDVPTEFKLKYQVPSSWLLQEDESDFLGARSSWRGNMTIDYRYFFKDGLYSEQCRDDVSLILEPEYSLTWPAGHFFTLTPFVQVDSRDDERTHVDFRELYGMYVSESFELSVGIRKIFWGVTESQNLVDVINQSDLVARGKTSDKLGQPMVNLSLLNSWGTVDFFVMPYFRERTLPGEDGRLRFSLVVETDDAEYESSAKETHVDLAMRYSHYLGDLEFGVSLFDGTSREPDLIPAGFDVLGRPTKLIPYYYQMTQAGVDVQYIIGAWLLKGELIHREHDLSRLNDYTAWTIGFEYTFTGIFGSETDLSLLSEWLYDDRNSESISPFENDIMVGTRLAFNDTSSSEIYLSVIRDLDTTSSILNLEVTRRLTDHWKLNIDGYWWFEDEDDDLLYFLRDDDFISCSLAYYF